MLRRKSEIEITKSENKILNARLKKEGKEREAQKQRGGNEFQRWGSTNLKNQLHIQAELE